MWRPSQTSFSHSLARFNEKICIYGCWTHLVSRFWLKQSELVALFVKVWKSKSHIVMGYENDYQPDTADDEFLDSFYANVNCGKNVLAVFSIVANTILIAFIVKTKCYVENATNKFIWAIIGLDLCLGICFATPYFNVSWSLFRSNWMLITSSSTARSSEWLDQERHLLDFLVAHQPSICAFGRSVLESLPLDD